MKTPLSPINACLIALAVIAFAVASITNSLKLQKLRAEVVKLRAEVVELRAAIATQ
jgi:hypothetical protein